MLEDNVASLVLQRESLDEEVSDANNLLERLNVDIEDAKRCLVAAENLVKKARDEITPLGTEKRSLELTISEMTEQQQVLRLSIASLQDIFKDWQKRADGAEAEYADKTASKEKIIQTLDTKILAVTQALEERQLAETSTRDELAKMQRTLDERDRNLRIRETKVEQGESKLIQNANLMNL